MNFFKFSFNLSLRYFMSFSVIYYNYVVSICVDCEYFKKFPSSFYRKEYLRMIILSSVEEQKAVGKRRPSILAVLLKPLVLRKLVCYGDRSKESILSSQTSLMTAFVEQVPENH